MEKILKNFSVLLILVLSSCGLKKDIVTPVKDVPINYRGAKVNENLSIGSLPIKEFFDNPAMLSLIDSALLRNFTLQIAIKNIEAANLILRKAKLGNIPTLNLQILANSNSPSNNSLNGISLSQFLNTNHLEDYNANLALTWEADIWGKIAKQRDAAYAGYLQSAEVKKAVQTRVVSEVAIGFYRLLMLDAQLNVAKSNIVLNINTLTMIKKLFDAGQVTSLAIQQAEAQQLKAQQLIPQITSEINIQENALAALTGKFPSALERASTLDQIIVPEQLAVGVPAIMLGIRPDVRNSELGLRIANAKVGIANAQLYPSLIISASGGLNSFKASNWFNIPASLFGVFGGGLTQPIFNRKELKMQFELAKIEREQSVLQFRQIVVGAVAEVSNEQVKILNLKSEYLIALERVETLQLAVKNSDLLFRSGLANYLEVITAQQNLLQGELELTSLKAERLNAGVSLYRALGGGWR